MGKGRRAAFGCITFLIAFCASTLISIALIYFVSRYSTAELSAQLSRFWSDSLQPVWNYLFGSVAIKMPDAKPLIEGLRQAESKRFIFTAAGIAGSNFVIASAVLLFVWLRGRGEEQHKVRACDDLLVNMSHDIRTPINGIVALADAMSEGEADESKRVGLSAICNSGRTLLRIVGDVLDLAKIESGRMSADNSDVNVREVVVEAVAAIEAGCRSKSIGISTHFADGTPSMISADGKKLMRILLNLLNNSLKNTAGGEISVRVAAYEGPKAGNILFSVRDTGTGIEQARLARVMNGVHSLADIDAGGSGFGLPISKGLVGVMGGELWAESESGRGSTFHFTINA